MLDKIIQNKLTEIEVLRDNQKHSINDLSRMNFEKREFKESLLQKIKIGKNAIIAELKKCSPSKGLLNENRDRHEHIGLGEIGDVGMKEIIKIMNKNNIPMILETPIDDRRDDFGNIDKVISLA